MYFTYLTIKAVIALIVTVLHCFEPKGMQKLYTVALLFTSGASIIPMCRSQHSVIQPVISYHLHLSVQSQPSCGLYQYCNMEISNNIYSGFQVSRSFKKVPLPHDGIGTFISTGIPAVPLTGKRPKIWSLGSSQRFFGVWGCMCISVSHIPEVWLTWIYSSTAVHNLRHRALPHPQNQGHSLEWCWLKTVHNRKRNTQ